MTEVMRTEQTYERTVQSGTTIEQAEIFYQKIIRELQSADANVQTAAQLFECLIASLRELTKITEKLKIVNSGSVTEAKKLADQLEIVRRRLAAVLEHFPEDALPTTNKDSDDALSNAKLVETGVWAMLKRLVSAEGERDRIKQISDRLRNEKELERHKGRKIKKILADAASLFKLILGDKETGPLKEMIEKLRDLFDNERCEKVKVDKELEKCREIIRELMNEYSDMKKILPQLIEKCKHVERCMAELGIKGASAFPEVRTGDDLGDQLDKALQWLGESAMRLADEARAAEARMREADKEQKKLDDAYKKACENLKRLQPQQDELERQIRDTEGRLIAEKATCDALTKSNEERRVLMESHVQQLKESYEHERGHLDVTVRLMQTLMNELDQWLARMKKEPAASDADIAALMAQIEKLLAALKSLNQKCGDDGQAEKERGQELDREEKELKERLEKACAGLEAASNKRQGLSDELRGLRKKQNDLADSEHEHGERASVENDEHIKAQDEIARMKIDNAILRDKANIGARTLETREQMLKELREKAESVQADIKRAEKENKALRWRGETGEPVEECRKCEKDGNLKQECELLRAKRDQLKEEMDKMKGQLDEDEKELEKLKKDRGPMSSSSDAEPVKQETYRRRLDQAMSRAKQPSRGTPSDRLPRSPTPIPGARRRGGAGPEDGERYNAKKTGTPVGDNRQIAVKSGAPRRYYAKKSNVPIGIVGRGQETEESEQETETGGSVGVTVTANVQVKVNDCDAEDEEQMDVN